jgi:hypothetical protein
VAIYDGHDGINDRDHPFTPRDLVTTELGNIKISDEENHAHTLIFLLTCIKPSAKVTFSTNSFLKSLIQNVPPVP